MKGIVLALTLALFGIVASADNKAIVISDDFKCKIICVDGMKFVAAYDSNEHDAISLVQILDKNGKPMECKKTYEEE